MPDNIDSILKERRMVKMRITPGPLRGNWKDVSREDPQELLGSVTSHGWEWQLDYTRATPQEKLLWERANIVVRAVRALSQGRSVTFDGKGYRANNQKEVIRVAGELEDAIVASRGLIQLVKDDSSGVEIRRVEYNH
jgi:hypothetical protein